MAKPTYEAERFVENQRLVYYLSPPDINFWDQHWQEHFSPQAYKWAAEGRLGWFEEPFTRWLPSQGRILEAGCGLGQYVMALRVRGYDVEGVEWAPETVTAVRTLYPDLPIRVADVNRLEVQDGYYRAYISLGVVEHRKEGPEPFLQEACRVLESGGILIISVPYFHPLRKLKGRLNLYRGEPEGLKFYQYAFTDLEFKALLESAGFKVIEQRTYDGFKGVKDEIPFVRQIIKWRWIGSRLQRRLQSWQWAEKHLGHMILFVCRKTLSPNE